MNAPRLALSNALPMSALHLTINGRPREVEGTNTRRCSGSARLVRHDGTKFGAAASRLRFLHRPFLKNGKRFVPANPGARAADRSFTTIEGLSPDASHPASAPGSREASRSVAFASPV